MRPLQRMIVRLPGPALRLSLLALVLGPMTATAQLLPPEPAPVDPAPKVAPEGEESSSSNGKDAKVDPSEPDAPTVAPTPVDAPAVNKPIGDHKKPAPSITPIVTDRDGAAPDSPVEPQVLVDEVGPPVPNADPASSADGSDASDASAPVETTAPAVEKVPVESAILGRSEPAAADVVDPSALEPDAVEPGANAVEPGADATSRPASPAAAALQVDEHDAPEELDTPAEAPSAFWLDGTRRDGVLEEAPVAVDDPDAPIAVPDDPSAYGPPAPDPDANAFGVSPMSILGHVVAPATRERLTWTTGQSFSGSVMETPVVVVHGIKPGPRLCLTAGVHGDELNGVEVVRRLAYKIEPQELAGTVIAVPIVNLLGFSRGTRYLPDRRDLNRFFPGSANGSSASRIAHSFFSAIIDHCDALVDFHTGSLDRANLPQVRGDLTIPSVVEFTRGFGATAVLHSPGALGMLRFAASNYGVPSVTFEIGGPMRLQPDEIEHGEQAIETLMHKMGMVERRRRWAEPQAVFYESTWVRVDQGGMLFSEVALGDRVTGGQRLGRVIDPVSNRSGEILAPEDGRVIGMALNQLVLPGFAAYHLGVAASEERVVNEAGQRSEPGDERFLEYDQLDDDVGSDAEPPAEDDEAPAPRTPDQPLPEQD